MLTVIPDLSGALPAGGSSSSLIDQIVREGARQMLAVALQAEVDAYIERFAGERDENGQRLVVRNGTAESRTVVTSAGAVGVTAPRVNDKRTDPATGERMRFSPVLAAGDGALGFWKALREVFPETREQRCWFHKIANVLGALPKSAHPGAKKALAEIWNAEDKDHARTAVKAFAAAYGAKFPKATAKITGDEDELLAFCDYPAEHWVHLRTTNPIESTFATVRHRTKVTRDPARRRPGWPWPTSSSSPPSAAGGLSTLPISSPWSAPAPSSSTASSSSDPKTSHLPQLKPRSRQPPKRS